MIRRAAGGTGLPVSNRKGRFLLVTDWEPCYFDEPVVGFEDLEEIILRILSHLSAGDRSKNGGLSTTYLCDKTPWCR